MQIGIPFTFEFYILEEPEASNRLASSLVAPNQEVMCLNSPCDDRHSALTEVGRPLGSDLSTICWNK
jgi:hypothetical protein